ncbi:hypothetical protein J6590_054271 [Homalodisca vitripennis]|nr:hypothetical protein J6590_054271 [Homalodisca vitripennis]
MVKSKNSGLLMMYDSWFPAVADYKYSASSTVTHQQPHTNTTTKHCIQVPGWADYVNTALAVAVTAVHCPYTERYVLLT